jgi:large subunit ribosomal protein L22
MKRIRPAPQGRAFRYQRRMSHIVIAVAARKRAELAETAEPGKPGARKKLVKGRAAAKKALAKKKAPAKKTAPKKSWKAGKK